MLQLVRVRWRNDKVPLLLYLLTFMVMSYPFVLRMNALPMNNTDTHTAMWQNWWMREALNQGHGVNYSPLLFYPKGLDLALQPHRWSTFPLWSLLYLVFGDPLAFNLTAMLGVLFKAYGMYLFGLMLFKSRIPAWVSGAFYAFSASSLTHALQQPNTGATEWIPWFMLAFLVGLSGIRARKQARSVMLMMIVAGFLFSLNAYMNLKIAIFAMLLGGGYVLLVMLAHRLWPLRLFWMAMFVFGLSAILFSWPLLSVILRSGGLESASSDAVVTGEWGGMDILTYVKAEHSRPLNYMQSIASLNHDQLEMSFVTWGLSHVGVVSMAFALMGVVYAVRVRRGAAIWVALALVFWLLSLEVDIYFNRSPLGIYWTPYRLLQDNFIFRVLKWPFRMIFVFLFPYSILIGYGLHYRLRSLVLSRKQWALLIVSVAMLLYGSSIFPIPTRPAPQPSYLSALTELPDGAVIDIPFGRHYSKYYMSVQRFHGRPIAEGMIARVPPDTYDYIDSNLLLAVLREPAYVAIEDLSLEDWQDAFAELEEDGFRYLILHREMPVSYGYVGKTESRRLELFSLEAAVHEDDEVLIYDMTALDVPRIYRMAGSIFAD